MTTIRTPYSYLSEWGYDEVIPYADTLLNGVEWWKVSQAAPRTIAGAVLWIWGKQVHGYTQAQVSDICGRGDVSIRKRAHEIVDWHDGDIPPANELEPAHLRRNAGSLETLLDEPDGGRGEAA